MVPLSVPNELTSEFRESSSILLALIVLSVDILSKFGGLLAVQLKPGPGPAILKVPLPILFDKDSNASRLN